MWRRKQDRGAADNRTGDAQVSAARRRLLDEIRAEARDTARWTGRAAFSDRVMDAMARVPREDFADFASPTAAYINAPWAIGHGQTISQPYIVALMTDLIDPAPHHVVFEVGTGSGYQAAVLSLLVRQVYSIETVPELAAEARARLARLGYDNVEVRAGDGALGWPGHAPFDGIVVTAAAPEIPPALTEQLVPGGRMVIPVGRPWMGQNLMLVGKDTRGKISRRDLLPVAFVPLTGKSA